MKYAVVQSGGKQYKISEGDLLVVDKIDKEKDSLYEFRDVLMARNEDNILIGKPNLSAVRVTGTIVVQTKGRKIRINKFKAKVRYRRSAGFRPLQTTIRIDKITFAKDKPAPPKSP